jgi:hypothetical protein
MLKNRSKLLVLLTPSLSSLVLCLSLSAITMFVVGFSFQAGKGSIYNYLFGKGSSTELIATSRDTFGALNNTILGNAILNKILYFAFWMLIGLLVYIILFAVLRGTGAAAEDIKEAGYANIRRSDLLQNFAIRFTSRLAGIFAWLVFSIVFIRVLLPFCSLAARTASSDVMSINGLIYGLAGFIVLFLSLHVEVILIRFIFLRVRLFSQQEVDI